MTYLRQVFGVTPRVAGQIGATLQSFTLDELLNRAETPDLEAAVGNEEDQVGMAIIVQTETNTTNGGSIDGYLSGTSSATADTFYGRRLTDMWVNETVSALQTVSSFTASTGGAGSASTAGQFTLVPGTYRIQIHALFGIDAVNRDALFGLYNATTAAFEVYSGTSEPIISTVSQLVQEGPEWSVINAAFTVTSSNKTYEIRQKASNATLAQALTCCGYKTDMTGTNVNGAAAKNTYTIIKIWRMT